MTGTTLDEQFAELPEHTKGALIGIMDAVGNAGRNGDLKDVDRFLRQLERLDGLPAPAKAILAKTASLVGGVVLDEHVARVQWARAEGFTGFNAFLAAIGHPEAIQDTEASDADPASLEGVAGEDETTAAVDPADTRRTINHALDVMAAVRRLEPDHALPLIQESMTEVDAEQLVYALAGLSSDILGRWADKEEASEDDSWSAWSQMVREDP